MRNGKLDFHCDHPSPGHHSLPWTCTRPLLTLVMLWYILKSSFKIINAITPILYFGPISGFPWHTGFKLDFSLWCPSDLTPTPLCSFWPLWTLCCYCVRHTLTTWAVHLLLPLPMTLSHPASLPFGPQRRCHFLKSSVLVLLFF